MQIIIIINTLQYRSIEGLPATNAAKASLKN